MESRGVTFLRPVQRFITENIMQEYNGNMSASCHDSYGLDLNENDVEVYYKKYMNNFKRALTPDEESVEQAFNDRLTPGMNQIYELKRKIWIFSRKYRLLWLTTCDGVGFDCQ